MQFDWQACMINYTDVKPEIKKKNEKNEKNTSLGGKMVIGQ